MRTSFKNFSRSLLGSWATQSLIENIAEGVGWISGQICGSYIGSAIGQVAFAKVGTIVGVSTSIITGYAAGTFFEEDDKVTAKSTAITAVTIVGLSYVIPPLMEVAFGSVGNAIGGCVGALSLGTMGAYASIKLAGSEERLFDFENALNNYTAKTAFSLTVNGFIGVTNGGICYVDAFVVNQIIGSVSFHGIEWMEFSSVLSRGSALDGCFPKRIGDLLIKDNSIINKLLGDIGLQELHSYIMLISADSEVLNLSNEFKVASANLCKSQSAKSKFKASSAKLALHIRGSIARTAEYKGLDDMLTTLARGESAVKFVLPVALCNILGKKLSPAVVNKVDFIKDDSGLWYLQLDENLLCGISKAVHKKFKGLERHVIGCELSGVVELDIIREFVSIHAANFCIFALSNLVKQGTIRDTAFVCSTYADSIKAEACSKELYKALNHIIFGYYQITTPSLFRGETLDTIVEIVDSQIDGGISY